jgi:NAD(P)H-dependent FMN reductase
MPEGSTLEVRTLHGIPLYDGDVETEQGIPAAAQALKDAIAQSDGVILATPEYNNSIPGVFKNAVDWLSRPPSDVRRVFAGRRIAIVGASPGAFGTVLAQNAWLPVLRTLGANLYTGGRLAIPRARGVFGPDGSMVDETARQQLRDFVAGFLTFVTSR